MAHKFLCALFTGTGKRELIKVYCDYLLFNKTSTMYFPTCPPTSPMKSCMLGRGRRGGGRGSGHRNYVMENCFCMKCGGQNTCMMSKASPQNYKIYETFKHSFAPDHYLRHRFV